MVVIPLDLSTKFFMNGDGMYLMYVDESGDPGLVNSPSQYFALSGLVIHEIYWKEFLDRIKAFRITMKEIYGLNLRDEIHSAKFIKRGAGVPIPKHNRLLILKRFAECLADMPFISVTNIIINKTGKQEDYDVFSNAWRALFQRFDTTLFFKNFPRPHFEKDSGMVFCDNTDGKKLTSLMRKMAVYNPVPYEGGVGFRNIPVRNIIEDPNLRNSLHSHFIQAADLCAFLLYQLYCPKEYYKTKAGKGYFKLLEPILNTRASKSNNDGIVCL